MHIHSLIQPQLHQSLAPIPRPRKLRPPSVPDHGPQLEPPLLGLPEVRSVRATGDSSAPLGRSPDKGRNKRNFPKKTLQREAAAGAAGPPPAWPGTPRPRSRPPRAAPGQRAPQLSAPGGSALGADASGRAGARPGHRAARGRALPTSLLSRRAGTPRRGPIPRGAGRHRRAWPPARSCPTGSGPSPTWRGARLSPGGWRVQARTPASSTRASGRLLNLQVTRWGEESMRAGAARRGAGRGGSEVGGAGRGWRGGAGPQGKKAGGGESSLLSGRGRTGSPRVAPRLTALSLPRAVHRPLARSPPKHLGKNYPAPRGTSPPLPSQSATITRACHSGHPAVQAQLPPTRPGPCPERICHILRVTLPALRKLTQCLFLQLKDKLPILFFFFFFLLWVCIRKER